MGEPYGVRFSKSIRFGLVVALMNFLPGVSGRQSLQAFKSFLALMNPTCLLG